DGRVEARDAVHVGRHVETEDRHREELVRVFPDLPSETEELLERDPVALDLVLEVLSHQVGREEVDAGGNGRVRGEDVRGDDDLARLVERETALEPELPDPLEAEERGMALVRVADRRAEARQVERADAADPE